MVTLGLVFKVVVIKYIYTYFRAECNITTITKGTAQGEYIPNILLIFHLILFVTLFTKLVANYATKKNIWNGLQINKEAVEDST